MRLAFLSFCALTLTACASYQHKVLEARRMMSDDPSSAASKLEKMAEAEGKDQLVHLLDYGTALQAAGEFKKSSEVLLKADEMADLKDYHSVSKITGSLLFNEGMVQYKGDDYEKVLINAMLAINFLMQNDLDGALVETRRINEKLEYYRTEEKKNYEQNVFAIYLSALIWEADRKWDDAYIAYEKAYKLNPGIPYLQQDLVRASRRAQRMEAHQKWKKEFGINWDPTWDDKQMGELVLVYQQGWGPRKFPHPDAPRFPKLFPVPTETVQAQVIIEEGQQKPEASQEIYSVEQVAIKTLDDAYAPLVAKRVAGLVVKEVAADQIRQKNELLGNMAWLAMHLSDQADLRQWSTLPKTFQIAKVPLKAGRYKVRVEGIDVGGGLTGEKSPTLELEVLPRKKTFFTWRSYQ